MDDLFSLEGKTAVVVGGAGGMGRAIAAGLIRYGADVALADVNPEALEQVAAALDGSDRQAGAHATSSTVPTRPASRAWSTARWPTWAAAWTCS